MYTKELLRYLTQFLDWKQRYVTELNSTNSVIIYSLSGELLSGTPEPRAHVVPARRSLLLTRHKMRVYDAGRGNTVHRAVRRESD